MRRTKQREGCQIDYLIQTKFDTLYLCEVKFPRGKIGLDVIMEIKEKIRKLKRPQNMSVRPVLVHVNGVTDKLLDCDYFAQVVDFMELIKG